MISPLTFCGTLKKVFEEEHPMEETIKRSNSISTQAPLILNSSRTTVFKVAEGILIYQGKKVENLTSATMNIANYSP